MADKVDPRAVVASVFDGLVKHAHAHGSVGVAELEAAQVKIDAGLSGAHASPEHGHGDAGHEHHTPDAHAAHTGSEGKRSGK